ncbi:hypothetical protein [Bartonella sp. AA97HXZ]|uniref:hypothetical protein n=1 Tax=Bartonella sp. AA97HXZ TaxID=1460972 RepID=UPI0035CE8BEF
MSCDVLDKCFLVRYRVIIGEGLVLWLVDLVLIEWWNRSEIIWLSRMLLEGLIEPLLVVRGWV